MSWVSDLVGKVPVIGPAINSVAHNVVDPLARGAVKNIPGGSIALGVGDALGRMVPGGSGGGAPGIQSITDFLSGNNGLNALGAAQGVNAALLGKKSNDLANKALDTTQGQWDANAGLRDAGRATALNPGAGIAAKLAAVPQGKNVYAPSIGPAR